MCFWASQGGAGQLVSSVTGTPPIVHTVHWAIESDQAHLPLFPVLTQLRHFLRQKVGGGRGGGRVKGNLTREPLAQQFYHKFLLCFGAKCHLVSRPS